MSLVFKQTPVVEYSKVNPNEHWPGRMYPEWQLAKLGEADNYEPDYNDQLSKGEN